MSHRYLPLPLLTVLPDLACGNPPYNLGEGEPALFTALPQTPQQWSQELALLCKALLVILCLQAPAEAPLQSISFDVRRCLQSLLACKAIIISRLQVRGQQEQGGEAAACTCRWGFRGRLLAWRLSAC